MGRFGEAADLVGTLLWLLSPAASSVTGVIIPIVGAFQLPVECDVWTQVSSGPSPEDELEGDYHPGSALSPERQRAPAIVPDLDAAPCPLPFFFPVHLVRELLPRVRARLVPSRAPWVHIPRCTMTCRPLVLGATTPQERASSDAEHRVHQSCAQQLWRQLPTLGNNTS